MPLFDFTGNAVVTTLGSGIDAMALSFTLSEASGWPDGSDGNWTTTIDQDGDNEEKILCGNRTGLVVTVVQRGYDGTTPLPHDTSELVKHTINAVWSKETSQHIHVTSRDDHTQYLNTIRHDVPARHGSGSIADNAIIASKIAPDAVTEPKIATDAVTATQIATGAVGTDELADGAVNRINLFQDEVRAIAHSGTEPSIANSLLWYDPNTEEWNIWDPESVSWVQVDVQSLRTAAYASVERSGTEPISSGFFTPQVLTPNVLNEDNDGMTDLGGDASRITPNTPGRYLCTVGAGYEGIIGETWDVTLGFRFNGDDLTWDNITSGRTVGIAGKALVGTLDYPFNGTTDYIEAVATHNKGSSTTIELRRLSLLWVARL